MNRLVIVPDEALEPLSLQLRSHLAAIVRQVQAENLANLLDEPCRRLLVRAVAGAENAELMVWGRSRQGLRVSWTTGSAQEEVVGAVTADANDGFLSRVFASRRSESQEAGELQAGAWTNLETRRGRMVQEMTASPFTLFEDCAGVLSLVAYRGDAVSRRDGAEDSSLVAECAMLLGRLLEDRLLRATVGIEAL